MKQAYYLESIELIKKFTGASKVVLFDHTVRRRRPGQVDDSPSRRQPVEFVHVDQTTQTSITRVHRHLPADEAPKLPEEQFQIINLWRPILHAASDQPLALCDYRSVEPEKDNFPLALWKYLRGMTSDEIVLIKSYDSIQDGKMAIFTPHTGFKDPSTPMDAPLRESIEVRALGFCDSQTSVTQDDGAGVSKLSPRRATPSFPRLSLPPAHTMRHAQGLGHFIINSTRELGLAPVKFHGSSLSATFSPPATMALFLPVAPLVAQD
ncbi:hypothetical protein CPB83DRAFT_836170 [Crepidotus variabilis]|uniref:Uncharacterized protein n=1 Tax=Crepidotus variabilis TaxID=179855 RepID=A0A9P6JPT8_9AGAR|nr:hypothetical protein CPB83DRAFT_836170 [Crepidotus variabilis]